MAMRPRTTGVVALRPRPSIRPQYEDFRPTSEWKQEQGFDILHVYLPGFLKEQLRVTSETTGVIRVRGERPLGNNKWSRFSQEYPIPQNCNLNGISAKFEGGILSIRFPKKVVVSQVAPAAEQPSTTTTTQEAPPPQKAAGETKSQKVQEAIVPPKTTPTTATEQKQSDDKSKSPPKAAAEPKSQTAQENAPLKTVQTTTTGPIETDKSTSGGNIVQKTIDEIKARAKGTSTSAEDVQKTIDDIKARTKASSTSAENAVQKTIDDIKAGAIATSTIAENAVQKAIDDIKERIEESKKSDNVAEKNNKEKEKESKESMITSAKEVVEKIRGNDKKKSDEYATGDYKEKATKEKEHEKGYPAASGAGGFNLENYMKATKNALMNLNNEERQALVNAGVAILVIVALGTYISYTVGSKN